MNVGLDTEHTAITCSAGKATLFNVAWMLSGRLAIVKTVARL
jgi:hypothetical protein